MYSEIFSKKLRSLDKTQRKRIVSIVRQIEASKGNYPAETIKGKKIFVSPKGQRPERILWYKEGNDILFYDFFTSHDDYVRSLLYFDKKNYTEWGVFV